LKFLLLAKYINEPLYRSFVFCMLFFEFTRFFSNIFRNIRNISLHASRVGRSSLSREM